MFVMPIGPHSEVFNKGNGVEFAPPVPADRHTDLYPNATIPRTKSFNPSVPKNISYLKNLPKLNSTVVDYLDEFYRLRLRALASVDDMVDDIFAKLEQRNLLDNTYIIYTSDNGFHMGQHRLQAGKTSCYEEDVNIPFMIRGPGIPKGAVVKHPTNHVDLAPTIFDLAGIPLRDDFDGAPMPIKNQHQPQTYESINVEFWGGANIEEGKYGVDSEFCSDIRLLTLYLFTHRILTGSMSAHVLNNTYKSVRIIGSGYNLMYSVWCTNEGELYDMHVSYLLILYRSEPLSNLSPTYRLILLKQTTSINRTATSMETRSKQ